MLTVSRNRTIIPGRADVTGDGFVGFDDLNLLLEDWGTGGG